MKAKKIKPLHGPYDQIPTFALKKRRQRHTLTDIVVASPNKLNIPDTDMYDAGWTHVDINEGQAGHGIAPAKGAMCVGPNVSTAAIDSNGGDIRTMNAVQCAAAGAQIASQNGGCMILTSQMGEIDIDAVPEKFRMWKQFPAFRSIEKGIGDAQRAKGYRYYGEYDGVIRYDILPRVVAGNLESDAAILALLRGTPGGAPTSPFGNLGFLVHTLVDGTEVRGAAEYRDILYSTYQQGNAEPEMNVALSAFAAMLCKRGLIAMADEISDATRKAAVLSRDVLNFTWNQSTQVGNKESQLRRMRPYGLTGVTQKNYFPTTAFSDRVASMLVGLIETKRAYEWEDTERHGTNPLVLHGYRADGRRADVEGEIVSNHGTFNGLPAGYQGSETTQTAVGVAKYTPGVTKLAYPVLPLGNMDFTAAVINYLCRLRGWVGQSTGWSYLSVKSQGDTDYCDASNLRRYVFDRYNAHLGWGYVFQNNNRVSIEYNNFHLSPNERETVSVKVGNTIIPLTDDPTDSSVTTLSGGQAHCFLVDLNG